MGNSIQTGVLNFKGLNLFSTKRYKDESADHSGNDQFLLFVSSIGHSPLYSIKSRVDYIKPHLSYLSLTPLVVRQTPISDYSITGT